MGYSTSLTPSASSSLERLEYIHAVLRYIQFICDMLDLSYSLEGLFPDDPVCRQDDTSPKLKYFYCSQVEGINSGDVAFLAGLLKNYIC